MNPLNISISSKSYNFTSVYDFQGFILKFETNQGFQGSVDTLKHLLKIFEKVATTEL